MFTIQAYLIEFSYPKDDKPYVPTVAKIKDAKSWEWACLSYLVPEDDGIDPLKYKKFLMVEDTNMGQWLIWTKDQPEQSKEAFKEAALILYNRYRKTSE